MLNLKKEADNLQSNELLLGRCPICEAFVYHLYYMQDADTKKRSKWYACSCGVVWQAQKPSGIYDIKYWQKYNIPDDNHKIRDTYEYPIRIYSPIIEELIYGRKVLLIGRQNTYQEDYFGQRGWIAYSIDKNTCFKNSDRIIASDFETHQFNPDVKFNLIWMYHTLESFLDPKAALAKCISLLPEDGIIFIATPDTDFINTRSSSNFIHWKAEYNSIMWNKRSLTRQLDSLGLNVILARSNYEHRFPVWDDVHLLAQKKFF